MKRNKFFMLGIVTVLVAVLSLTFVSNTFAKYTSTVTGSDSAKVAKWAWTYNGDVQGTQKTATVDLFKTAVYEYDDATKKVLADDDAEVKNGVGTPIIAPGTGGVASFTIKNDSEVSATYAVIFGADEKSVPLKWSTDNINWEDDITSLNDHLTGTLAYDAEATTITLYWCWDFDGDDTDKGEADPTAAPTVTVTINVDQIN